MTTLTEGRYAAEFVMMEREAGQSRDNITIALGVGIVVPGTVLAKASGGTAAQAAKSGGNTGNGTLAFAGTPVLANAKPGVYAVRFTSATAFTVEDPDGIVIGNGSNGVAFADGVAFTITAGGTPFVAGDGFDLTVDLTTSQYKRAANTEKGVAIALYRVDATSAAVQTVAITRDATVNSNLLTFDATVDNATKRAVKRQQLEQMQIIVR